MNIAEGFIWTSVFWWPKQMPALPKQFTDANANSTNYQTELHFFD